MRLTTLVLSASLYLLSACELGAASFDRRFEEIKHSASKEQLYAFLFDLPKGGDLHNHSGFSYFAEMWYEAATDKRRTHGNEFYTRTKIGDCPESARSLVRFVNIQRSTYRKLPECRKSEYELLSGLSPKLKTEWLSSLKLDGPGKGRDEFFGPLAERLVDLFRDPYLMTELLVENMRRFGAEGVRYLETQAAASAFIDLDGNAIDTERGVQLFRERLSQADAKATGVTVRFQATIVRFRPNAEELLENVYDFVDRHRDLWVGINMAGREDNGKGYALRFLDTFRRMRRKYSGISLSLHAGEMDSPGQEVRNTLLLGATRIGHGLNLITDPDTMLLMRNGPYLVETNLTSNRLLEYTPDLSKHPFPEYLRFGIPVCLNTDDRGAWDSNMTDEYYTAVTTFNLTWAEIVQLGRNSLVYSFAEPPLKERMLKEYDAAVLKFENKYSGDQWAATLARVKPAVSGYAARSLSIPQRFHLDAQEDLAPVHPEKNQPVRQ